MCSGPQNWPISSQRTSGVHLILSRLLPTARPPLKSSTPSTLNHPGVPALQVPSQTLTSWGQSRQTESLQQIPGGHRAAPRGGRESHCHSSPWEGLCRLWDVHALSSAQKGMNFVLFLRQEAYSFHELHWGIQLRVLGYFWVCWELSAPSYAQVFKKYVLIILLL